MFIYLQQPISMLVQGASGIDAHFKIKIRIFF